MLQSGQSGHGRRDRQKDGRTDGQTDGVKPIYPPTTSLFGISEASCCFMSKWRPSFLHIRKIYPFNSTPPSATYMHQCTGSTMAQVMACRLLGTKPLPEPMLNHCQLDHWEWLSMKFKVKYKTFHSWKCIWSYRARNDCHFVKRGMN